MSLAALIEKLVAVFNAPRTIELTGAAEERANKRLADREDALYLAIARHQVTTPTEFYQKLLIVLEGNELIPRENGKWGGVGVKEAKALVRAITRDADRLFVGKDDDRLMELIAERVNIVAQIDEISAAGDQKFADTAAYEAGGIKDHERKLAELNSRLSENERHLARCKVRNFFAAGAVADLLRYDWSQNAMGICSDDCVRKMAANLAAFFAPPETSVTAQKQAA